ncbi:TRIO and F-actin-binding protein isoform B [Patagioenas fasciata monilis]|uniref:TRIO and F-actin-binding protein isoform B n=1 Tax=Patagioenas fasciata monilis TaxID=372326 RepID=A0A1V4JA18_PATFA|nr:TRIO and F-actin-binding protein isoform B [Patagioenas fasciata monilis]
MNFEANIFAKSLCQHCFRAAGAHQQHTLQEHAVEVTGRDAGSDADPDGPWDALRILAPQCEVYVCVGPAEGTERSPPKTCFAVDVVASRVAHASPSNGLLPVPERRPASQKPEERWPKHRIESGYFSLERRKTDPLWASTPPRAATGSSPARSDSAGSGRHLAGSRVREPRGQTSSTGTEGRHGLEKQKYTVLADLPKPKCIGQQDAVDRCGSRTLSPGRVEVERIFGCERRKSETLEAFQALEEGRVERLDGKTPVPPSKGRLARRQSSPSLPREGQRVSWHLEQRSRGLKEPLHSSSPTRHPERVSRNQRDPPRPTSSGWLLERGSRSSRSPSPARQSERRAGEAVSPPWRSEKSWRSQGEPSRPPNLEKSRAVWQARGLWPDDSWKRPESPAQQLEDDWKGPEHTRDTNNPEKPLESDWGNKRLLIYHPQLGRSAFPPQSSTSSSGSPKPHFNASEKHNKPDLLNFKKGWMSILDEPGEWKKHWFVLTDSSLRYYRDSNAEEADDLDGEIDLRSCTDVTEFAVQRNYGFQIHTKDAVFTLSAMTSGIRRNWIEALRKNVRPVSAPDVTKLSDCDKENSFRNCVPQKSSLRTEEQQRPGSDSEGNSKSGHWKADGQRHAFDYVELSPLPQDPGNQGSPQRTRGSLRVSDRAPKHEELERDLAIRSEERRKWFETPDGKVPNSDGLAGDSSRKAWEQDLPSPPLSEEQRIRLNEEIEKKWLELERLPLKDSRRVPLTTLLNQSKGGHGDANEALKKEIQSLRAQLESCRARNESLREAAKSQGDRPVPRGYISQEACERSLAEMESSHQQVMEELQRHHQRELERLRQEKERLLAEEAAATAAAIEALKKAHREEMNKELGRTRSFQQCGSVSDALQKQHQLDVDSLKRELQVLSEQYSQKCLEIGELTRKAEEREQTLLRCQQEGKELLRKNQELQTRLSDEIEKLRSFISSRSSGDHSLHSNERSSCELEVLLRVKENELQYLKKEVQCLREELQMMQKDKRFASGKYQDVYAELNHIKRWQVMVCSPFVYLFLFYICSIPHLWGGGG